MEEESDREVVSSGWTSSTVDLPVSGSSFQLPASLPFVQLTDAQLQQLTSQGAIQPLYATQPEYATGGQRFFTVLMGQHSTPSSSVEAQPLVPVSEEDAPPTPAQLQPLLPIPLEKTPPTQMAEGLADSLPPHFSSTSHAVSKSMGSQYGVTSEASAAGSYHNSSVEDLVVEPSVDPGPPLTLHTPPEDDQSSLPEMLADPRCSVGDTTPEGSHLLTQVESNDSTGVRKSHRIAELEKLPESFATRPKYEPRPYSITDVWCEDCQTSYEVECSEHKQQSIADKVVVSHAWASLPSQLQIFRLGESATSTELGVFAKKALPKRVTFGPFVAEQVTDKSRLSSQRFLLQVDQADNQVTYLEASDENQCNWMMFVRPATSYAEQNLVAFQRGPGIYFSTIKAIEARQELKVWYAASYAEHIGASVHEPTQEDLMALGEEALRWPCYLCPKKFPTSMHLQRHLALHEKAELQAEGEEPRQRGRIRSRPTRRRGRPPLKKAGEEENEAAEAPVVFQSWKKTKTKMYLNKMKKYREPIKRSIKTLFRQRKGAGPNEWVCTHCGLNFDNSSLLNLHTLTHAAEDVGLDELRKLAAAPSPSDPSSSAGEAVSDSLVCPVCAKQFEEKQQLIEHAGEHARRGKDRPFPCPQCPKSFATEERLARHMLCHSDGQKPFQCPVCLRQLMTNSALACHLKTHSDRKYYECPLCHEGFDQAHALRAHAATHAVGGQFECPECHKVMTRFEDVRRHMRSSHSPRIFPCPHCDKVLPRADKLRLHMLKHSSHREFMCETCGRQFKRKDKLKEHTARMHGSSRSAASTAAPPPEAGSRSPPRAGKRFVPKVSPSDYERFIYKCHLCLLGFKRRGMLVNHLASRHPGVKAESVPELNLPILKAQRDYFCQYCDKVYKSSSKRKWHILKNHPGAELPASARQKAPAEGSTFSQTVGSVTTMPHSCPLCHKQYASKAKLLQHLRKAHQATTTSSAAAAAENSEETVEVAQTTLDALPPADLLTQAMSELTQSLDYRQQVVVATQPQQQQDQQGEIQLSSGQRVIQLQSGELGQLQYQTLGPSASPPLSPSVTTTQIIALPEASPGKTVSLPAAQAFLSHQTWTPSTTQLTTYTPYR